MQTTPIKPLGTTTWPSIFCAIAGVGLAVGLHFMQLLALADQWIQEFWKQEPFFVTEATEVTPVASWVIAAFYGWLVATLTLHSARNWRRLLVGLMLIATLVAFHPVLILWDILWMPTIASTSVAWAWLCAILYASQHTMPSEAGRDHLAIVVDESTQTKECLKVETVPFPTKKKAKQK